MVFVGQGKLEDAERAMKLISQDSLVLGDRRPSLVWIALPRLLSLEYLFVIADKQRGHSASDRLGLVS